MWSAKSASSRIGSDASLVAGGNFPGGIFFTTGALRGNTVPREASRGGPSLHEAVVFDSCWQSSCFHMSTPVLSKDGTHLLPSTEVTKDGEMLLYPASAFLLLERLVLLNGHALKAPSCSNLSEQTVSVLSINWVSAGCLSAMFVSISPGPSLHLLGVWLSSVGDDPTVYVGHVGHVPLQHC